MPLKKDKKPGDAVAPSFSLASSRPYDFALTSAIDGKAFFSIQSNLRRDGTSLARYNQSSGFLVSKVVAGYPRVAADVLSRRLCSVSVAVWAESSLSVSCRGNCNTVAI
jgi:hypothetical protein